MPLREPSASVSDARGSPSRRSCRTPRWARASSPVPAGSPAAPRFGVANEGRPVAPPHVRQWEGAFSRLGRGLLGPPGGPSGRPPAEALPAGARRHLLRGRLRHGRGDRPASWSTWRPWCTCWCSGRCPHRLHAEIVSGVITAVLGFRCSVRVTVTGVRAGAVLSHRHALDGPAAESSLYGPTGNSTVTAAPGRQPALLVPCEQVAVA
jgi:hypothetical protein